MSLPSSSALALSGVSAADSALWEVATQESDSPITTRDASLTSPTSRGSDGAVTHRSETRLLPVSFPELLKMSLERWT